MVVVVGQAGRIIGGKDNRKAKITGVGRMSLRLDNQKYLDE